ncbi:hypothetical protein [Actinomadura monticuli]|uniref:Restriction endonuclease subunit S n=1 Tax=Actinomadura monticuli TaxID=3097367 RepID=A0ABV4QEU2_9ACTN
MVTSTLLDLRRQPNWDPARLTAEAFQWPTDAPQVRMRDLLSRIAPTGFVDAGTPTITLAGIDPNLGGVRRRSRKYQGAAYQVGADLRAGDLLVPRTPTGVVLLVSERMVGALISSTFYALRSDNETSALWIWGLLNCRSGRELRRNVSSGSAALMLSLADLLDMQVPVLPLAQQHSLAAALRDVEATTHIPEDEAAETWWRTADLRGEEWRFMLASPQPDLLRVGTPLRDFCGEIAKGRPVRDVATESEETASLPVVDISMLAGNPARRWVPAHDHGLTPVYPGDLCVAAVGERPHAAVIFVEAIADPNVYVLRLRTPAQGPALAQYLNGQEGFALRKMLISGAYIPNLRRQDLEQLPIREEALHPVEPDVPVAPLADRLEQLLWLS